MTETTGASSAAATTENPGRTLGIAGLILAIFVNVVGLIVSIIGLSKSKKAGFKNTPAVWGIVISILSMVIGTLVLVGIAVAAGAAFTAACAEVGPGVHEMSNGTSITCPE